MKFSRHSFFRDYDREIKVLQETLIRSRAGLSSHFYRQLPEHREIKSREIWPL